MLSCHNRKLKTRASGKSSLETMTIIRDKGGMADDVVHVGDSSSSNIEDENNGRRHDERQDNGSGGQEQSSLASSVQPNKHRRDSSVSITLENSAGANGHSKGSDERPAKRRLEKEDTTDASTADPVTEFDVGIRAYIDQALVPIEGGIIKQRFSDFHVREVTQDGQVCRITSLEPSQEPGGHASADDSLLGQLRAEIAERDDATGSLRQQRLEREQQKRETSQAERVKTANRTYEWSAISDDNKEKLQALFGAEIVALKELWESGPQPGQHDTRTVTSVSITDKDERRAAHQLVREAFEGLLVTTTVAIDAGEGGQSGTNGKGAPLASALSTRWDVAAGTAKQSQSAARNQQRPQPSHQNGDEAHPPYIHFLLQKTNRDTQDALNLVARSLGLIRHGGGHRGGGAKAVTELSTAGTKDKRGITVQRVSVKRGRKTLDDVWRALNGIKAHGGGGGRGGHHYGRGLQARTLIDAVSTRGERGLRAAHFTYSNKPLFLGGLGGNEFEIVLRNVKVSSRKTIDAAMDVLKSKGFINYYGMQRFGTSSVSTHSVGVALLRNDYCTAVNLIMATREGDTDVAMAARSAYAQGDFDGALRLFPNHNVPERSIVSRMRGDRHHFQAGVHPRTSKQADWSKYFAALPRTLRTMYIHAYQSYAWNSLASERINRFGSEKAIVGDYVLLADEQSEDQPEIDDDIAQMDLGDEGDASTRRKAKVIETEDETKEYTIHDVVIPLFGSDVQPIASGNWMSDLYKEILAKDNLKPDDVARGGRASASPEMHLRGDYRVLLHRPRNVAYHLVRYTDPDVNLLQSDEDRLLGLDPAPPLQDVGDEPHASSDVRPAFLALVVRFTLGVSAYATMALREILKQETSMAHQRSLTARGEDRVSA